MTEFSLLGEKKNLSL